MKLILRDKTWEFKGRMTVREAILKAGLNPEDVLATRDGKLIQEQEIVEDDDVIRLVAVISGGR